MIRPRRVALVAFVLAVLPLTGCGEDDPYAAYCDVVSEHRDELSRIFAEGGAGAAFEALPMLRDLRDRAPDDIRADWNTLIGAIEGLEKALADAGVEPAGYDRADPPEGLSGAEKAEIDAAARRLGNRTTTDAALRVQQQARDVCQEPLTL